jgi:hypothetical protein
MQSEPYTNVIKINKLDILYPAPSIKIAFLVYGLTSISRIQVYQPHILSAAFARNFLSLYMDIRQKAETSSDFCPCYPVT